MLSLMLLLTAASSAVQVQTRDMKSAGDDGKWRRIGIQIINSNSTAIPLDSGRVQYAIRERADISVANIWCFLDHDANWQYSVQGVDMALPSFRRTDDSTLVLDIRFKKGIKLPAFGAMEIQLGIYHTNWSVIDQSKDPSYLPGGTYHNNPNVIFGLDTASTCKAWEDNSGIAWNPNASYGILCDARDGQSYRTVQVGSKVLMAQNLNFRNAKGKTDTVGVVYANDPANAAKYGRLYTWNEAMAGSVSSSATPSGVTGVCPAGWHVPSFAEMTSTFAGTEGGTASASTLLKATEGWVLLPGTDIYGFRGLPGGSYWYLPAAQGTSYFSGAGYYGNWWTASDAAAGIPDQGIEPAPGEYW